MNFLQRKFHCNFAIFRDFKLNCNEDSHPFIVNLAAHQHCLATCNVLNEAFVADYNSIKGSMKFLRFVFYDHFQSCVMQYGEDNECGTLI